MLRKQRRQSATFVVLTLTAVSAAALIGGAPVAYAEVADGTLTVVVNRDENGDSRYDSQTDPPQPGIEVEVTDAAGASVRGITDDDGQFVLTGTDRLAGGQYLVDAAIPPTLSELAPVTASATFAPFSTKVDLRGGDQTVRLGVASTAVMRMASPAPQPSMAPPSAGTRPTLFAVGDQVWRDLDRSGRQDPGEPPVAGVSVQLLTVDGDVLASTVSSATGRFAFDDLPGGTYAVRFAGLPSGSRLTVPASGNDPAADSDPDYTGATPPFTLGVDEPNVRASTAADGVRAAYIQAGIDAGITPVRYAIGERVWLDLNADGGQQPDEPAAAATVSLLQGTRVVASTTTDPQGGYWFTGLEPGQYRVRFEPGKHRRFTARNATSDPVHDSDAQPGTGVTSVIDLGPGAPDLVPASDLGVAEADLVNATVGAGLVGAYTVGDTVWRDDNGNGVLDAGEQGVPGVKVELLDEGRQVLRTATTADGGRFAFGDLAAGAYRLQVRRPDPELVFTGARTGSNTAVDSDADPRGLTAEVMLGEENPADTTVDVGLTRPADLSTPPGPVEATPVPVDTQLSTTGGVAVSIPIAGLALVVSGLSCLLAGRRPTPR